MPSTPSAATIFGYDLAIAITNALSNGLTFEEITQMLAVPHQIHGTTRITSQITGPAMPTLNIENKHPAFCVHTANHFTLLSFNNQKNLQHLFEVSDIGINNPAFASPSRPVQLTPTLTLPLETTLFSWKNLTPDQLADILNHHIPNFPLNGLLANVHVKIGLRWIMPAVANPHKSRKIASPPLCVQLCMSVYAPQLISSFYSDTHHPSMYSDTTPLNYQAGIPQVSHLLAYVQLLQHVKAVRPSLCITTPTEDKTKSQGNPTTLLQELAPANAQAILHHWPQIGLHPSPLPITSSPEHPFFSDFHDWTQHLLPLQPQAPYHDYLARILAHTDSLTTSALKNDLMC